MRAMISRGRILDREPWEHDWVEGYYVCLNDKEHLIYSGYAETDCGDYYPVCEVVDPDTVGRYTGWTDTNGNLIFEGDILLNKKSIHGLPFEVEFRNGGFRWRLYGKGDYMDADLAKNCEVIGNIHDNPELLENEEGGLTKR